MSNKNLIFIFGTALFLAFSVTALMTGCSTTAAHMTTSQSDSAQKMDLETAKAKMKMYMDINSQGGYELKKYTEDDLHFRADVLSPEGTLQNEIVVNKKTGAVYFTKKK